MPSKNTVYFKYYTGTPQTARNAVKNTVTEFLKKTGSKSSFLNDYTISVADDYKDLKVTSEFARHLKKYSDSYKQNWGASIFPQINNDKKEIVIKTEEIRFPQKIWSKSLDNNILEQATLHEIGHLFDDYYGNKDEKLLKEIKKINLDNENLTPEQQKILNKYKQKKDLSDNQDFKDAWKKDTEQLGKNKNQYNSFKNGWITQYYAPTEIDITDGISAKEIEEADRARSEVFAQLFGYALGKDDGKKNEIISVYPTAYKIVKNYIKKYLNIDCK